MWFTLWTGMGKLEAPGGVAAWNFAVACMVFGSLSPWFVAWCVYAILKKDAEKAEIKQVGELK